jgi:predicted nicotinamide N-methyase
MSFLLFFLFLTLGKISNGLTQALNGIPTHRVPLRSNDPNSLYSLAVSTAYWYNDVADRASQQNLHRGGNFLATQVWPSARVACLALERLLLRDPTTKDWTMCEFGCGPGLPSLMAAKLGMAKVIATDLDDMALQLVQAAAQEQDLAIETRTFDLMNHDTPWPSANLYVFSDVFESNAVARGAAKLAHQILSLQKEQQRQPPIIWVFCQSDRVQRDVFSRELQPYVDSVLRWQEVDDLDLNKTLWLCNVDESQISYL